MLDAGHPRVLRRHRPRMAGEVPRAPDRGPARRAAHPEMAERRRAGGRDVDAEWRWGRRRGAAFRPLWPTSTCTTCSTCGSSDGGRTQAPRRRDRRALSPTTSWWDSSIVTMPSGSWPSCASGWRSSGWSCTPRRRGCSSSGRSRRRTGSARGGQAGDVQLPRLHAHLREEAERAVHGAAADDAGAAAGEAEGGEGRASAPAGHAPVARAGAYLRAVKKSQGMAARRCSVNSPAITAFPIGSPSGDCGRRSPGAA